MADQIIKFTANVVGALEALRVKPKFHEDSSMFYPGAPDEGIRARCEAAINSLIGKLLESAPDGMSKEHVLLAFSSALTQLDHDDSEEKDRAASYVECIMDILGIESSDGLLNRWRYGFDPNEP